MTKLNRWKRKGLYYEKTVECHWLLYEENGKLQTAVKGYRTDRLFCLSYWILKYMYPERY